jgi:hypothetical protein
MRFKASVAVLAGAIALRLAIGVGFANYDTLYSLAWGQQLARGQTPSYKLPLAPTPHPLLEALGVILSPLGRSLSSRLRRLLVEFSERSPLLAC